MAKLAYLTSDRYGVNLVGTEGDTLERQAQVWHEEAWIEELGVRAWARLDYPPSELPDPDGSNVLPLPAGPWSGELGVRAWAVAR